MQTIKWTDRKFHFGYEPGYLPLFVERLSGTIARIKELTHGLSETALRYQPEGKWCIKQHIGHLTDLEELHEGRLEDFHNNLPVLRPADMTNKKTEDAGYIDKPLSILVKDFEKARNHFILHVKKFSPLQLTVKSFHPRLKEEITVVDLLFFLAEHDTSHLAQISSIIEKLK
jgi:hypothetical protein